MTPEVSKHRGSLTRPQYNTEFLKTTRASELSCKDVRATACASRVPLPTLLYKQILLSTHILHVPVRSHKPYDAHVGTKQKFGRENVIGLHTSGNK